MLTEKIIEHIFSELNASASRDWRDDRHLVLTKFKELDDDEIRIVFNMGKDDITAYHCTFAPDGYDYVYDGSGSNLGDAEGVMQILMNQYDSAHYMMLEENYKPGWHKLTDEPNGISVVWEHQKYNDTQVFDPSGFDLGKYVMESANIIATICRRMTDWLVENYPELVMELDDRQLFGLQMARLRRLRGYTIRELAEESGCAPATIVNIEQGKFSPRVDIVEKILDVLDASLDINLNN